MVLNFTPPEALVILQAAQKLGLEDRVKAWACSTPCNSDFVGKALGPKWNHKFFVNGRADPTVDRQRSRDAALRRSSPSTAGRCPVASARSARWASSTPRWPPALCRRVKGACTLKSVNAAIKAIKNYKTEQLCKPFTYGDYPEHIPNNTDYTVTPNNGVMAIAQGCRAISSSDPQIAAYHKIAG